MADLLRLAVVAERLTISKHMVSDLIDQGELEEIRISARNRRVPADSLEDFLKRKRSRTRPGGRGGASAPVAESEKTMRARVREAPVPTGAP
jgi:excisionase family DNA binding protein